MIKIQNLSKKYKDFYALKDINLSLPSKGLIGISGESGSGKTTLLNALSLMDEGYNGSIIINKKNILKYNEKKKNNYHLNIGYVFQTPYLFNFCTVKENIELMSLIKGKKMELDEVLKKVGLLKYKDKKVNALSGGQRQRVSIATSLISKPLIFLCDEPTGALDSVNSLKVMEILKEISNEILVVVVSHDHQLLTSFADEIIYLENGMIKNKDILLKEDDKKIRFNKKNLFSYIKFLLKMAFKNIFNHQKRTLITAFMVSFGLIGIIISILLKDGFSLFFSESLGSYSSNKYMYCYKMSDSENIEISLDTFEEDFKEYDYGYFYRYDFRVNDERNTNKITYKDSDLLLNFNNLAYIKKCNSNLLYDEIGLGCSSKYLEYLLYIFNMRDINEFNIHLLKNDEYLNFKYLDDTINLDFKLRLKYIYETDNEYSYFVHSSPLILKNYFKDYMSLIINENKKIVIMPYIKNKEEDKDDLLINKNKRKYDYIFDNEIYDESYTFVIKSNYYRFDVDEAKEMGDLIDSEYYITLNEGIDILGRFPNTLTFSSKEKEINGENISFSPLELDYKSNYDIAISSSLFSILGSDRIGVKYKDNLNELRVIKIIESDELIIYQDSYWSYSFFKELLDFEDYRCMASSISFIKSDDNSTNILKEKYSDFDFVCPLKEVNKEIDNLINKVQTLLVVLSSFCIIISFLLMAIIIFINTIEQEKLISLLRINGIRKEGVSLIFIIEGIILGGISFVISLWTSFIFSIELNAVFNMLLEGGYIEIIKIKKDTIINVFSWVMIMSILSSLVPSLVASKKVAIKVLKN